MQSIQHRLIQRAPNRCDSNLLDHFLGKAVSKHVLRQGGIDAAAFEIEHLFFVDLANRSAVRALHIIGENFELRLGIDLRFDWTAKGSCWSAARQSAARHAAQRLCR